MTTKDLKELNPKELQVAAKTLILSGYTTRKVEEILGVDHATAARYADAPTPEDMRQFETIFKEYIDEKKKKGITMVHDRLLELVPKERRIDQVVKAGEFLEGINKQTNLTQVNIGGDMGVKVTTYDPNSITQGAEGSI